MKRILQFFQKDVVYITLVALICLFYRVNDTLDIAFCALLFILLMINVENNKLFYTYFALIFFEPILVVPVVGGTFFRVFYIILAMRVVLDIMNKDKLKKDWPIIVIGIVFFISSFIYSVSLSRNLSVALNVLTVTYISLRLRACDDYKKELSNLLNFIVIFSMLSGIFGALRIFAPQAGIASRMYGTIDDPNYSALFYVMGLFATFGAGVLKNKWVRTIVQVLLVVLVFTTASMTGIVIMIFLSYIWFAISQGTKKALIVLLVVVILITCFMFIPFDEEAFLGETQSKISRFVVYENPYPEYNYLYPNFNEFEFYLNRISSNRYYLAKQYTIHLLFSTPISQQFFGGNNPIEGNFRYTVPVRGEYVSHNTYIDMMFMMGYVLLAILLACIAISIISNYKNYLKTKDKEYISIVLIKMTMLLFATMISIFPYRYFIAFLLI